MVSGISRIVQKCTIHEMSHNLLNFWKVKQIAPSSQISSYGLDRVQKVANSYHRHKVRPMGKQVVNSGNTKPPFGRSWFKSRQLGFLGMYNFPLSCFAQISADPASAQSLNPHSCMLLQKLFLLFSCRYTSAILFLSTILHFHNTRTLQLLIFFRIGDEGNKKNKDK